MFPRLRHQVLARLDLLVELSTLGEYGLDEHGSVMALDCERSAPTAPRVRDRCGGDAARQQGCDGRALATERVRAAPAHS